MKKEFETELEMDDDDIAYVLGHNTEQTHITLTVISKIPMTGIEYLAMMQVFVDKSGPDAELLFTDKFSHICEIQ